MITALEFPVAVTYLLVGAVILGLACRYLGQHLLAVTRAFLRRHQPLSPDLEAAVTAEDAAVQRARTILERT